MTTQGVNQWPDETKRSPFPFVDGATMRDAGNELILQSSWVRDAMLWPVIERPTRVFIRSIERTPDTIKVTINSLEGELMTAETSELTKSRLVFFDSSNNQAGFIQFAPGGMAAIHDHPTGVYRFSVTATEFVASCVAPRVTAGLRSVTAGTAVPLTTDIRIVGGDGVRLVPGADSVRVDVVGDAFYKRDLCDRPGILGLAVNPVRAIAWRDVNSGHNGIVRPVAGNIITQITTQSPRGFASPGDGGTILGMLGA